MAPLDELRAVVFGIRSQRRKSRGAMRRREFFSHIGSAGRVAARSKRCQTWSL